MTNISVLPQFVPHQELVKDEMRAIEDTRQAETDNTSFTSSLAAHLDPKWFAAKRAKEPIERSMLSGKRARKGEYEPAKLLAIQQLHGKDYKPVYMLLIDVKCRAAEYWIEDILIQHNEEPWDLEATPVPDLPPAVTQQIESSIHEVILQGMLDEAMMTMQPVTPEGISAKIEQMKPMIKQVIDRQIKKKAKEAAARMKEKIADQFTEGGWHKGLKECIHDIVTYKACIIKGPSQRKQLVRRGDLNINSGKFESSVVPGIISKWERRSPFDIFPSPESTAINNGYLFDRISLTRSDLSKLIGVEGFDEVAIRAVLRQHSDGGLREWTSIDPERATLDNKESTTVFSTENIDCLEYWGSVPGRTLISWAGGDMEAEQRFGQSIDPELEYDIAAWKIGSHIIKAMLNPDPMGKKPFDKASFVEDPDSFWGKSVCDILEDLQTMCNAVARAIVNNVGIGSAPQVEINTDRLAPGQAKTIWPWRIWETTNAAMQESPAVRFYMPPIVVDQLMKVYQFFLELADNDTGIPRYEHGQTDVGGAGQTASGLSMLMTSAARGIKGVVKNLDEIIKSSVERQYYHNLDYEDIALICDLKVVARGSSSMIAKEQLSVRRREILNETNNPTDLQIIGMKGRKELLEGTLKAIDVDTDQIWEEFEWEQRLNQMNEQGGMVHPSQQAVPQLTKPQAMNPAGDRVAGQDFGLFQQGVVK